MNEKELVVNKEVMNEELSDDMFELLDDSEKNSEFIAIESKTFARDAWDRFKKNKLALAGLIFLVVMVLLCWLKNLKINIMFPFFLLMLNKCKRGICIIS